MLQGGRQLGSELRSNRAFGRSVKRDAQQRARYFEPLMRVSFRHQYYNRVGNACPDLAVFPTGYSQRLMSSLGLVFQDEGTGFSVFYNTSRTQDLESYLRRQGTHDLGPDEQFWTRLTFVLQARSPYFVNITDIPIDTDPTEKNFYFSNQDAHADDNDEPDDADGPYILNRREAVGAEQLVPVLPAQYQVTVVPTVIGVVVRAISGEVVMCEPRCIPDKIPIPPPGPGCSEWLESLPPTPPDRCRSTIYLDFSLLPEDEYTIQYLTGTERDGRLHKGLYRAEAPTPFALVDLLFSKPTANSAGVYPIKDLASIDDTTIASVDYVLSFDARPTSWTYYIVPQPPEAELDDLVIESHEPHPDITFTGPSPVILVNDAAAYRFVSDQPLLLQQQSTYRFSLHGRRRLDRRLADDTLVERLPVAGNQQVLPRVTPDGRRNYSDIYVYV